MSTIFDTLNNFALKHTGQPFSFDNMMEENDSQNMILKQDVLDDRKIKKYIPNISKKEKEPESFNSYIGQNRAKVLSQTSIQIIKNIKPIHILINGFAGCGKTTLARIIAKELNADFIYRVPEQIKGTDQLLDLINYIQTNDNLTVLMIDEIHTINKNVVNVLLPIMQDLKFGNADIKPFVLIGATTNKDRLAKANRPFLSRFQSEITLEKYSVEELTLILKKRSPEFKEEDLRILAENARRVPREAIAMLLNFQITKNIKETLKQFAIIRNGVTEWDIKILKHLSSFNKPMGANFLSQAVGITQSDYEQIYERFLVEEGYIIRSSRGREITEKGKNFLLTI